MRLCNTTSALNKVLLMVAMLTLFASLGGKMPDNERYVPETDPLVLDKLEQWQGIKFGLLMHWGAYSQWGVVESWSVCPEEYGWCERKKGDNPDNYFLYKQEYEGLAKTFNPVNFDPQRWAKAAHDAGMRYVVFTTKHHDGFCMFDSKYTDYKVTGADCPFSSNPKANIAKEIFDAFRAEGLWAGAYFSKPDWHVPSYWDPAFPPRDRNVNYDPETYPEKWEEFVTFTHNQILELMSDYGRIDILWLDGGWVARKSKEYIKEVYDAKLEQSSTGYIIDREVNQDIRMDELVSNARKKQPGLIVVDRAVHGKNQNYLTPENRVPEKELPYPWESCIIAGGGWSYTPDATYMDGRKGVQMLVDIVAKGGNLLLNIAPSPTGEWQQGAYDLLGEFAAWMKINNEAIYNSTVLKPYKENNICMTRQNDGTTYFFYMCDENETTMPSQISIASHCPASGEHVYVLGCDTPLSWEKNGTGGCIVHIPADIAENPPCNYVWTLKVGSVE